VAISTTQVSEWKIELLGHWSIIRGPLLIAVRLAEEPSGSSAASRIRRSRT
jgi:hypothetical protein